ncbi:Gfo/Idh/MocA family protein [Urechidicola croceus]|uniref:Glucose-fructose oxidoreductase n=1 Tax=Urechidicola croceus TaxID=1850246 RepID=A0A1D8P961_9FLAO|nr:Gfo/Idh/MocA family oxidoreductase [Urechidicola croceus]AOW21102.1 hypothetical protein LPB138_10615 [Urechidicola croceus]
MKRRPFIKQLVKFSGGALLTSQLPLIYACAKPTQNKKLGIALVGLGSYAGGQLAPALLETEHCYLAGIVTGTKEKESVWSNKYDIPKSNIYNYENFDSIADNDAIDIVYVVLPNSMHAEYTIRAAKAGKHVICEKPMATSIEDCKKMIAAAKNAGKKLAIGYRLHYDPFNDQMMKLGQNRVYGKMNIESSFAFNMGNRNQWRAKKALAGGGPLMDLGIYCIQGCIYTFGELPTSVSARYTTINEKNWPEVEGSIDWELTFPSGKATCSTSYEKQYYGHLTANTEKGKLMLSPAFVYNGLRGTTPDGPMTVKPVNQQAKQMDAFALNIINNSKILVPGEMGLRDNYIIEKIYESANNDGKEILLSNLPQILDLRKI